MLEAAGYPDKEGALTQVATHLHVSEKTLERWVAGGVTQEPEKKQKPSRQAFVSHYLACFNKAEAARRSGYSEKTARQQGHRLFTNADIQAEIQTRITELKMSSDEVLVGLAQQARFYPLQFMKIVTEKGGQWAYIDLEALKEAGLGYLVKEISYDKDGHQIVKFHDAQTARIQLGKANGALSSAGDSETKPFIVKVVYGERGNSLAEEPALSSS